VTRLLLAVSGASGAPYARRLLRVLRSSERYPGLAISLVLSRTARQVYEHECGEPVEALGLPIYGGRDYAAPFASGSSAPDAMLVLPASMSCIARIAHGISDDLLTRAADVVLKERKRLVVVPREAPYSSVHLENMLALTRAGAVVIPASPSFYGHPRTLEDAMDSVLSRVLDHLGLPNVLSRRWGEDVSLGRAPGAARDAERDDTVPEASGDHDVRVPVLREES
jgi:4-hydroxy-3-polyprenylbenzoate decarboxylase